MFEEKKVHLPESKVLNRWWQTSVDDQMTVEEDSQPGDLQKDSPKKQGQNSAVIIEEESGDSNDPENKFPKDPVNESAIDWEKASEIESENDFEKHSDNDPEKVSESIQSKGFFEDEQLADGLDYGFDFIPKHDGNHGFESITNEDNQQLI